MNFKTLIHAFALLALLFTWTCEAYADDPVLIPKDYRIKINDVDASKAPQITIRATFLDKDSHSIPPDHISMIEVTADDKLVTNTPEITRLLTSDIPVDLALVIPKSKRFTPKELEAFQDSVKGLVSIINDKKRKNDRIAGFFDDGRSIVGSELGKPDDVQSEFENAKPQAQSSFLYSSLEKAIDELSDSQKLRSARRAIILVTDTYDSYIFRSEDVQREILELYQRAKEYNIHIYVVMYNPLVKGLDSLFEGLSRKTGGTFRKAELVDDLKVELSFAMAEIYNELLIEFSQTDLKKNEEVVYRIKAYTDKQKSAESNDSAEILIENIRFNWKKFFIGLGIAIGIIIIALIVFLIVRHQRKKNEEMEAAIEEQKIQEGIERGEICPKCRRSMMPGWKECMFCAREAAEEINKAKAEKAKAAKEAAEKKAAQKPQGKVCPKCHRTMMPGWTECMFCKAGIGGDGGAAQGLGPTGANKNDNKKETGERICPVCKKPMKPHWTTCLYCEANTKLRGNADDAGNDKKKMPGMPGGTQNKTANQNQNQPQVRICPTCKRPMKPHWDTCLYCEANHARQ